MDPMREYLAPAAIEARIATAPATGQGPPPEGTRHAERRQRLRLAVTGWWQRRAARGYDLGSLPLAVAAPARSPTADLAHVLDDDVGTVAARRLLHGRGHIARLVVHDGVGAELPRPLELLVARGRCDHAGAESLREHERRRGDAAARSPDEDPFVLLEVRARDEHPVGGLEDERERGSLLEREAAWEGVDVLRR